MYAAKTAYIFYTSFLFFLSLEILPKHDKEKRFQ